MTREKFRKLACNGITLDGATGTELIKLGMPGGVSPELWLLENPDALCQVHNAYKKSGSDILYAPTFGANRCKLAEYGAADRVFEINSKLITIAKNNSPGVPVFADIAPTGKFVAPFGEMDFEAAVEIYKEQAQAAIAGNADGFVIETMMDLQEARAAYIGVRETAPDLPVIVTMTFESSGRTLTGNDPVAALTVFQSLGADAFGCNCSTGPEEMAEIISAMKKYAVIPLVAKPNAGLPCLKDGKTCFPMAPAEFAAASKTLFDAGAAILGGCCGTTPEHIAKLNRNFRTWGKPQTVSAVSQNLVASFCSYREVSPSAPFAVIGERINPTGKKALQQELRNGATDMIFDFAVQQTDAGAAILDVNMGASGVNEPEMMLKAITRITRNSGLPLCIDSTDPETVEKALRFYPGRAILNSISAETNRLEKVLPVAAKYGALPILLPLTDAGIPATAAERIKTVELLLDKVAKYGYSPQEVIIDALVMSVSADSEAANNALAVIDYCKSKGLNCVCGLSNVSFGLPARNILNRTFLGMAIGRGLNMAIANPLFADIMELCLASDALNGKDLRQEKFIAAFAGTADTKVQETKEGAPAEKVRNAVLKGDKENIVKYIQVLQQEKWAESTIISDILIPAITEVGKLYEAKKYFLPQLIASAEAMQAGTAYLEKFLLKNDNKTGKTRMIFATVRGDIHDIGKNIVIVMMKNYGFDILDLGKDVAPEKIIETAIKENIDLIGLSSLMTTTMGAIQETVELAKKLGHHHLKFIAGGAVVDQNFADMIGAYYAKDPMDTVRIARKLADQ